MISAVILTKNEEKNIKKCLESIKWCDELIVVDDQSTDKTTSIAEKMGAKIYVRELNGDFSKQRNFGLEKAKGDWILFVDADERVTEPLWFEIMQHTNSSISNANGFYIKRRDIMWDRELSYGETGSSKFIRLGKKGFGKWEGAVHEKWKIKGKKIILEKELVHYPHDNVKSFLNEINFYTSLRAEELQRKNVKSNFLSILIYPVGKFFINYITKQGFRDGAPGLINAVMMSFHSFLVRSKLWLITNENK